MGMVTVGEAVLRALQRRAEAMAHDDLRLVGQAASDVPAVEDPRRASDVLGAHTAEGLPQQHAYIAALSTVQEAERGRLARELHDEVVQQLIALAHGVDRVGLLPALELLLRCRSEADPEVVFTVEGAPHRLAPQSELALFASCRRPGPTSSTTPGRATWGWQSPTPVTACL